MNKDMFYLSLAGQYAKQFTGCTKVAVGSCIVKNGNIIAMGANRAIPDLCQSPRGCLRVSFTATTPSFTATLRTVEQFIRRLTPLEKQPAVE